MALPAPGCSGDSLSRTDVAPVRPRVAGVLLGGPVPFRVGSGVGPKVGTGAAAGMHWVRRGVPQDVLGRSRGRRPPSRGARGAPWLPGAVPVSPPGGQGGAGAAPESHWAAPVHPPGTPDRGTLVSTKTTKDVCIFTTILSNKLSHCP